MTVALDKLPEQVRSLVLAVRENAKQVWDDESFIESLLHVDAKDDGSIVICDNYERFFDLIWVYGPSGDWSIRWMYSDRRAESYTYEQAMADASILYTG